MPLRVLLRSPLSILLLLCLVAPPLYAQDSTGSGVSRHSPVKNTPPAQRPYAITEKREPCDHYNALRQVFWGDTHVHTAYSLDAGVQDTRNRPDDAYRYAKGERVGLQPYTSDGEPLRHAQISAPLDFSVVTDHGEALGMVGVCTTPGYDGYRSLVCKAFRNYPKLAFSLMVRFPMITRQLSLRHDALYALRRLSDPDIGLPAWCGEDGKDCADAAMVYWVDTQDAAERAYDRSSACTFTSFVGYEWTGNSEVNLHRNVIFRNDKVLRIPLSYVNASAPEKLLRGLEEQCIQRGDGCDVLSIPHNSNLSEGQMFPVLELAPLTYSAQDAKFKARLEPLVEIMQHKGDSECWHDAGVEDEFCGFEQLPYNSFSGKFATWLQRPSGPNDGYIRDVLYQGMRFQRLVGANPYQLGLIAATDTHLGTPGAAEEWQHQGHGGAGLSWSSKILAALPDDLEYNPGGLMGVWAEENSRDSLFEAMRRREVYGTSGPRISVRMFALPDNRGAENLCEQSDRVEIAYREGVPMGTAMTEVNSMRLFVDAVRDPGTPEQRGNLLQRIQVIKGWLDEEGHKREQVIDIAGGANGAGVDLDTCQPYGTGENRMCAVWEDSQFNPLNEAYYYARVLENPSCRWSARICNAWKVDCSDVDNVPENFRQCCSAEHQRSIQERAWTSPVWYSPQGSIAR